MTNRNRSLRVVFIATIAVVFILSIVSYTKTSSLIESAASVNNATQVTLELEKVIGALKDAEAGHRGYLLTHDTTFLESFTKGLKEYPRNIETVRQLTIDNPKQQESLAAVRILARHREAYMREMLAADKLRAPSTAQLLTGKSIMDSLRTAVNGMIERQSDVMRQRSSKLANQTMIAPALLFALGLLALVILTYSYWRLNKSMVLAERLKAGTIAQAVDIEKSKVKEESEKMFRDMVQQAPVAICVLKGEDFVVEIANEKQLQIWGKTKEQVMNLPIFTAIPEGKGQGFEELLAGVMATGKPYMANEVPTTLPRNGKSEIFYTNFVYEPLYINNKIYGIISVGTEVTEHVTARKVVEETAAKFNALADNIPNLAWMATADGWIYWYNKKWYDYTGTTPEQMEGWGWQSVHDPARLPSVMEKWQGAIASGDSFEMVFPLKGVDGAYRQFLTRVAPIRDNTGVIKQWFGTNTDITEQLKIQEQLKITEERYATTISASGLGLWDFDVAGKKVIAEGNMAQLYWLPSNEAYTIDAAFAILHPGDREEQERLYQSVLDGSVDSFFTTEFRNIHPDTNAIRWLRAKGKAFCNNQGVVYRMAGTTADITAQKEAQDLLKESENRYRSLIDNIPMMSFIVDPNPEATVSYWNKIWLDYTGQTHEEALGRAWDGIIYPDDVQGVLDVYVPAFEKRQPYFIPAIRVKRHDGIYRWHLFRGNPRYSPNGEFLGYVGVGFDIHEQKLTQDALMESEERFRIFSNNIQNLAWIAEGDGNIFWYNQRWLDYTGLSLEEMQGWGWQKVHHPDHVESVTEISKKLWITNEPFELTFPLRRADGQYRWFLTRGVPITDEHGKIHRWIGTNTDIDDKIRIESQSKEREEKFRSLVQTLPQLVWVTDTNGMRDFASFRWQEYTGVEPGGETEWKAIVHPDDYDNINNAWAHSLSTGTVYRHDVRLKSKEGQYRWHTVVGEPVRDEENEIVKWVGAFTDVHSEKTFSNALEKQVSQRTAELEIKNAQLEALNKELQTFAYISSHDLQEPLRKIQTFSTRIVEKEHENLSERGRDYLGRMQSAALRMQTLIQDLLAYSRTTTEERAFVNTDLNKILKEVKEDLSEEIKLKNATIDAHELGDAHIIPFQFRQLMQNLMSNSLKFSTSQTTPRITVRSRIAEGMNLNNQELSPDKKYCHISLADNGIGFEKQYNEKIFEVFQRLHGRAEYHGTGIGLSIVKKIVENHNGIITADGEPNKGATFDIYIPAL